MDSRTWRAPTAHGPVRAALRLPGSKSISNRALLLAALSDSPSTVRGVLKARDTSLAIAALRVLGCSIEEDGTDLAVSGGFVAPGSSVSVDVGNAGTVMRFLPAVAALSPASVAFDGDPRARERPVGALLSALRTLGVSIDDGGRGALPVEAAPNGRRLRHGGRWTPWSLATRLMVPKSALSSATRRSCVCCRLSQNSAGANPGSASGRFYIQVNDGPNDGPGSVAAAQMAVKDFGGKVNGVDIEIVSADHLNKPDIGVAIVRKWIDEDGVDAVADVPTSSVALAVQEVMKEKQKVFLISGAASSDLTVVARRFQSSRASCSAR